MLSSQGRSSAEAGSAEPGVPYNHSHAARRNPCHSGVLCLSSAQLMDDPLETPAVELPVFAPQSAEGA
jgi:hypothetical protein